MLHRVILSTSNPGDVIVDPFFGTGTTGAVAKKLGRKFIGFEMEDEYIIHAKRRLEKINEGSLKNVEVTKSKRAEPKVPFGTLIERGLIKPGTKLFSPNGKISARVRPDASLATADFKGSIHKVGAHVQGAPSCNGWTFWHYKSEKGLTPIDAIRTEIRAEMV